MTATREYLMQFTRVHGPIAFTMRDVDSLLEDDAEIETFQFSTTVSENRIEILLEDVERLLVSDYRKAVFILTCNSNLQPSLTLNELAQLTDCFNAEPPSRDLRWALLYDDAMPTNQLSLTVIIARN